MTVLHSGSASATWYGGQEDVADGFSTTFSFRIFPYSSGTCTHADGLAFVIQNQGTDAIGAVGEDIGYGGIVNSLAVEFDTYQNSGNGDLVNDPNGNHIAVQSRGTSANSPVHDSSTTLGINSALPDLADSNTHIVTITYDAIAHTMKIYMAEAPYPNNPPAPTLILTVPVNLRTKLALNAGRAWVGFTGATACGNESADILNWRFVTAGANIGVYDPSTSFFYLRSSNSAGPADASFIYGSPGKVPLTGDWDGDGIDTIGIYDPAASQFFLRNSNTTGNADIAFIYGSPGDQPFSGRWETTATHDGIGVFHPSNGLIFLRDDLSYGPANYTFAVGLPGWKPVSGGKWDLQSGQGLDFGMYAPVGSAHPAQNAVETGNTKNFSLVSYNCPANSCSGGAQTQFLQTLPIVPSGTTYAIAGDWSYSGQAGVGVYDSGSGTFNLKNAISDGSTDNSFVFGRSSNLPVAGHWGCLSNCTTLSQGTPTATATLSTRVAPTLTVFPTGTGVAYYVPCGTGGAVATVNARNFPSLDGERIMGVSSGVQLHGQENRVDNPANPNALPTSAWIRFSDYNSQFGSPGYGETIWIRIDNPGGTVPIILQGNLPANCTTPVPTPVNATPYPTSTGTVSPPWTLLCQTPGPGRSCSLNFSMPPATFLATVIACEADNNQTPESVRDIAAVIYNRLHSSTKNKGSDFGTNSATNSAVGIVANSEFDCFTVGIQVGTNVKDYTLDVASALVNGDVPNAPSNLKIKYNALYYFGTGGLSPDRYGAGDDNVLINTLSGRCKTITYLGHDPYLGSIPGAQKEEINTFFSDYHGCTP